MRALRGVFFGLLILLGAILVAGGNGNNYYDDYALYTAGYHYDDSEDGGVFEPYTDSYGDADSDYYFDNKETTAAICKIGADGVPVFDGTRPCDLVLANADSALSGLTGGIDGIYEVWSCQNGRPLYKRENSPPNEDRILWFSDEFRDWDLVNGTTPRNDNILMFAGNGTGETQADYVSGKWSVASEFLKESGNLGEYEKFDLKVTCVDWEISGTDQAFISGELPLLSHSEMDAQYKAIYERAAAKTPGT